MAAVSSPRRSWLHFSEVTAFLALVLGLVFVLVYRPIAQRADLLDRPLRQAWDAFARTNQSSVATAGVTEDQLPARRQVLEAATADLAELRRLALDRIELPANVIEQFRSPFQLIDFDNERLQTAERLAALAKAKKVGFQPGAASGLPQYPSESAPAFLWPRLHIASQVLLTAIHCQVGTILELAQLPPATHRSPADGSRLYEEIPMRIEVVGAIEPLGRFLTSLPLRGPELAATGLAEVLTNKPALFVSRILARKSAPERPNDARLEIVVSGFVPAADLRRDPRGGPR